MATINGIEIPSLTFAEQSSTPATPDSGNATLFRDDDGNWYEVDDTGAVTEIGGGGGSFDPDVNMPWHHFIPAAASTPDATVGTWAQSNPGDVTPIWPGMIANATGAAVNDAIAWDLPLAAGTWSVHVWVRKSSNTGIITVQFGGVDKGTADTYNASAAYAKVSVAGITVATTAKTRVNLKAATKHASSSSYVLGIYAVELRRTA